jgi:hypothetical protein
LGFFCFVQKAEWFKTSSEDNVPKTHHDFYTKHGKFHPRKEKRGMSEEVRL